MRRSWPLPCGPRHPGRGRGRPTPSTMRERSPSRRAPPDLRAAPAWSTVPRRSPLPDASRAGDARPGPAWFWLANKPARIAVPPGARCAASEPAIRHSGRARIFASTRSYGPPARTTRSRQPSARRQCSIGPIRLSAAFWRATRTDQGSISVASTRRCRSDAAAIARMPDPVPRSRIRRGRRYATRSSARRHPRVDPCSPEPNASPASSVSVIRPAGGRRPWCVPRTAKRRPINCCGNAARVRASHPSAGIGARRRAAFTPVRAVASASAATSAASPSPAGFTPSTCQSAPAGSRNSPTVLQTLPSAASNASSATSGTVTLMVSSPIGTGPHPACPCSGRHGWPATQSAASHIGQAALGHSQQLDNPRHSAALQPRDHAALRQLRFGLPSAIIVAEL